MKLGVSVLDRESVETELCAYRDCAISIEAAHLFGKGLTGGDACGTKIISFFDDVEIDSIAKVLGARTEHHGVGGGSVEALVVG